MSSKWTFVVLGPGMTELARVTCFSMSIDGRGLHFWDLPSLSTGTELKEIRAFAAGSYQGLIGGESPEAAELNP